MYLGPSPVPAAGVGASYPLPYGAGVGALAAGVGASYRGVGASNLLFFSGSLAAPLTAAPGVGASSPYLGVAAEAPGVGAPPYGVGKSS